MSAYGWAFEQLEAFEAGTVLEIETAEGDVFRIKAEGGKWHDWLPVEGHLAPPHLQPNLGTVGFSGRGSRAYGVGALSEWFDKGFLAGFRVVAAVPARSVRRKR